ncbi:MAG: hypothetical protein JWQ71_371 [Pedosphaera sp.]|nr:hypothetical protein [Pedosphaera sp.]
MREGGEGRDEGERTLTFLPPVTGLITDLTQLPTTHWDFACYSASAQAQVRKVSYSVGAPVSNRLRGGSGGKYPDFLQRSSFL